MSELSRVRSGSDGCRSSICTAVSAVTAVERWTDLPSGASDHTLHVWRWVIPRTEPDAGNMTARNVSGPRVGVHSCPNRNL